MPTKDGYNLIPQLIHIKAMTLISMNIFLQQLKLRYDAKTFIFYFKRKITNTFFKTEK